MITPTGAALFTRKENQGFDYGWYVQIGITQLQEMAKAIYSETLCRDVIGNSDSVSFSVIQHGQQIGLLIADMLTSRRDFSGRPILTTLYVEFKASDRRAILSAATTLLKEELDLFLAYAEDLFTHSPSQPDPIQLPQITLSSVPMGSVNSLVRRGLVYSPITERCQYADFLAKLPAEFCFVSTGHVSSSQYETLATHLDNRIRLLVLTLTETEIVELSDQVVRPPYKHWLQLNWVKQGLTIGLLIIILVAGGGGGYYLYDQITTAKRILADKQAADEKELRTKIAYLQAQLTKAQDDAKKCDENKQKVEELQKKIGELQEKLPKAQTVTEATGTTSTTENAGVTPLPTTVATTEPLPKSEEQKQFETWLSLKAVDNDEKLTDKTIGDALRESRKSFKQWLDKKPKQPTTKQPIKDWFNNLPQPAYFFLEHYCIEFTLRYQQMSIPPGVENYCEEYVEYEKKKPPQNETVTVKCSYYFDIHTQNWKLFPDNTQECFNDN